MKRINEAAVPLLIGITLFWQASAAYSLEVKEAALCTEISDRECSGDILKKCVSMNDLPEDKEGKRHIYYWTKIALQEDRKIMHVWIATDRSDVWRKTVHLGFSDKMRNHFNEIIPQVSEWALEALRIKFRQENPTTHSVQGIVLPVVPSGSYRTYSSLTAVPGVYRVEAQTLKGERIPGEEAKTIRVTSEKSCPNFGHD